MISRAWVVVTAVACLIVVVLFLTQGRQQGHKAELLVATNHAERPRPAPSSNRNRPIRGFVESKSPAATQAASRQQPATVSPRIPTSMRNDSVRVAWLNRRLWRGVYRADPILRLVEGIVGMEATLTTKNGSLHSFDTVDVFLVSQAGTADDVRPIRTAYGDQAIFVFVNSEPDYNGYNYVDLVDVSFGQGPPGPSPNSSHPLCAAALRAPTFLRTPFWVLNVFGRSEPFQCRAMDLFRMRTDPEKWISRPRLALHVARHNAFPRTELRAMLDAVGERARAFKEGTTAPTALAPTNSTFSWRVDVPGTGKAHYNMPWPPEFRDDTWGKIRLGRLYRYSLQPENSRTACGGYVTDKVVHGHMAGAVPLHWGDGLEPGFWNPARVLVLEPDGRNLPALAERVYALETNATARAEFFAQPVLAAGADAWAGKWCDDAERLLRDAILSKAALRARFPWLVHG